MEENATSRCPNTGAIIFNTPAHIKASIEAAKKVEEMEEKISKLEEQNSKLLEAVEALLKAKE